MRDRIIPLFLALLVLGSAIETRPGPNSTELYRSAERLALNGRIDEAIAGFQKALEINPHYSLAHYGLGKAYLFRQGLLRQAVYHLERAVDLDKGLARAYFYLGMAYMFSKRYGQSLNAFNAAYELDRNLVEALYNMAVIYDLIKQGTMSARSYDRYLLERNKRDSDILF
ncbi:MAG TPA: tetratricopeptide repeat protein [Spirochaetota bacterium]|nr:tetratricopeptide repeat protein [Spirochaetota bacterium]OPZ36011.1 MAG: lipoprotein NlpI [Spirochaetes bacterium ADurb.BinA120]HNU90589.1 tetratricopeptide repeat protein [Spirochaetota bacterium]HPO44664.1 tetratricopeptide repeat protein [Spirochaetota bacterium]HPV96903.1 tetratricopeptide repeat protein [Spirochaetota bacterium]